MTKPCRSAASLKRARTECKGFDLAPFRRPAHPPASTAVYRRSARTNGVSDGVSTGRRTAEKRRIHWVLAFP